MTAPSVLEKVRMCVAEAGHDPTDIRSHNDGKSLSCSRATPYDVFWRAGELAGHGKPVCWACCREALELHRSGSFALCLADRRLVLDCGRTR